MIRCFFIFNHNIELSLILKSSWPSKYFTRISPPRMGYQTKYLLIIMIGLWFSTTSATSSTSTASIASTTSVTESYQAEVIGETIGVNGDIIVKPKQSHHVWQTTKLHARVLPVWLCHPGVQPAGHPGQHHHHLHAQVQEDEDEPNLHKLDCLAGSH